MTDYPQLLQRFGSAIQERLRQEALLAQSQKSGGDEQARALEQACAEGQQQRDAEIAACQRDYDSVKGDVTATYDTELTELDAGHRQTLQRIERKAADDIR